MGRVLRHFLGEGLRDFRGGVEKFPGDEKFSGGR